MVRLVANVWIFVLLSSTVFAQDKIEWRQDVEQAKEEAKQDGKLVLLHFTATWCKPCQELERFVFVNPLLVREINQDVIAVKVDVDELPGLTDEFDIQSCPTDVLLDPHGKVLVKRSSPRSIEEFIVMIEGARNQVAQQTQSPDAKPMSDLQRIAQASQGGSFQPPTTFQAKQTTGAFSKPNNPENTRDFRPSGSFSQQVNNEWAASHKNGASAMPTRSEHVPSIRFAQNENVPTNPTEQRMNQPSRGGAFQPASSPLAEQTNQKKENQSLAIRNPYVTGQQSVNNQQSVTGQPSVASPASSPSPASNVAQASATLEHASPAEQPLPRVALDGFCPVTLIADQDWVKGSKEWGCVHRGKLFFFHSQERRDLFMQTPEVYSPLLGGADPVQYHEEGTLVEGKRKLGVFYETDEGHQVIVLFNSSENRERFEHDPSKFVEAVRVAREQVDQKLR